MLDAYSPYLSFACPPSIFEIKLTVTTRTQKQKGHRTYSNPKGTNAFIRTLHVAGLLSRCHVNPCFLDATHRVCVCQAPLTSFHPMSPKKNNNDHHSPFPSNNCWYSCCYKLASTNATKSLGICMHLLYKNSGLTIEAPRNAMHRNLCLECRKPCGRVPAFGCNPGDATCIDWIDCKTCEEHGCL